MSHGDVIEFGCLNGEYRYFDDVNLVSVDNITCQDNNAVTMLDSSKRCVKGERIISCILSFF